MLHILSILSSTDKDVAAVKKDLDGVKERILTYIADQIVDQMTQRL